MNHRNIGPVIAALFLSAAVLPGASAQTTTASKGAKITGMLVEKGSERPSSGMWLHLLKYEGKDKEGKDVISLFILNGQFPRAKSDSTGRFSFADVPAGRYVIKSGTENTFAPTDAGATALKDSKGSIIVITLLAGDSLDMGKVRVEPSASPPSGTMVTGVLVSERDAEPVKHQPLLLFSVYLPDDKDDKGKPLGMTLVLRCDQCPKTATDEGGHFTFENVPRGKYTIGLGSSYDAATLTQENTLQVNGSMVVFKAEPGVPGKLGTIKIKRER